MSVYLDDIKVLKVEVQMGEIVIRELRKKLKIAQKEKDGIQLNVKKLKNASKRLNKLIECQIVDNCKKGLGYEIYNEVPPPYTRNFMLLTPDLSFTSLEEFANKPVVENSNAKSCEEETKLGIMGLVRISWEGAGAHEMSEGSDYVWMRVQGKEVGERGIVTGFRREISLCLLGSGDGFGHFAYLVPGV
nr:hypothetical protein [Tanacetum cinerariifolium]